MEDSYNYGKDDILILSDIAHIQKRRTMYISDAIDPSPLFSEILDNSVDELQNEFGIKIQIFVKTDSNTYILRDFGRGIPHGSKKLDTGEEKEVLEILLTKSNSGGKFTNINYKRSGGLHGLGITVTNALSSSMKVASYRDGECVSIYCEDGDVKDLSYSDQGEEPTGTYVEFTPNPEYFESEIIPESYIINRCRILKAFGYNIEYYKDNELQEFNVESIYDLLPKTDVSYCRDTIKFTSSTDEEILVAFDYTSEVKCTTVGYTNMIYNSYGGTHTNMIYNTICDAWSQFYKEVPTQLKWDDCALGLNVLVAVFIGEISFSSQTKEKLTVPKKNLEELMEGFKNEFIKYLQDNPELRKGLLKRFEEYRISQNKLLSQKEIMNVVKLNDATDGKPIRRRSVVKGLIECTSTTKDGTELFIVEGNSAAGPVARARDRKIQSVLPLRGKIKNVTYMDIKDALKSETIQGIVNSIGAGVGDDCDPNRSRYEKINILTDSDSDGYHIAALILSVLVNITPNMVKDGLVYVVQAPLYSYVYEGVQHYSNNMDEIPEGYTDFKRFKGLGEMNDQELKESCLTPGNRTIYRVQYPNDIDKFNEILGTSSGRSQLLKEFNILVDATGKDVKIEED